MPEKHFDPFVIYGLPRSGTTLLVTLLDSHPQILCHEEAFNQLAIFCKRRWLKRPGMKLLRDLFPHPFAHYLLFGGPEDLAQGFKILDYQAPRLHGWLLRHPKVRKIIVSRDNPLATYSSDAIASATGQWRASKDVEVRTTRIVFDPHQLEKRSKRTSRFLARTEVAARTDPDNFFSLEYAEITSPDCHRRLLDFLGVDSSVALEADLQRQNSRDLSERFEDWDAVCEYVERIGRTEWLTSA